MTGRTQLDRRMRWVNGLVYAGFGVFIAGIVIGVVFGKEAVLAISIPGFVVAFIAAMVGHLVAFQCPRCQGNLGALAMQRPGFCFNSRIRFCPYCGAGIDEEMGGRPSCPQTSNGKTSPGD